MGTGGGSKLRDRLETQKQEIEDYYGAINEIKMGVRTQAPRKPDLLAAIDLVKATGLPLVAGGLMDQPHIWLLQWEMAESTKQVWDAINALADSQQGSQ